MNLKVVTPEKIVYQGVVNEIEASGVIGKFVILPDHAPIVTQLKPGPLEITNVDGRKEQIAISGGYLQFNEDLITILAETAEKPHDIDIHRARKAKERAEKQLHENKEPELTRELELAIERATTRLQVGKKS